MEIAILGTIVKDRIISLKNEITESFGGLFYSIETLRALCSQDDKILPISFGGSDIYDEVINIFANDSRIVLDGLYKIEQPNNRVELHYINSTERTEYSQNPMPSLSLSHVIPFLNSDILLVNFISGWDIGLEDLKVISKNYHGIFSMDIHSLTLDRKNDGRRKVRKIEKLNEWLMLPDIVQFNKKEFEMICNSNLTTFYNKYCFDQNKIVNLTLGKEGSISLYREKNGIVKIKTPPVKINVTDPTGCGDVFLAAFSCEYGKNKNIIKAAQMANLAAAIAVKKDYPNLHG